MSPAAFIERFRALHERAKSGRLTPDERAEYASSRASLTRMLAVAQQLGHPGEPLRGDLRMAKLLKLDLHPDGASPLRLSTIDLASGGFAALMPMGLPLGRGARFTLHLPAVAGAGPISGRCTTVSSRAQGGAFRVSFRIDELTPSAQEQLDVALIDAVLERFTKKT